MTEPHKVSDYCCSDDHGDNYKDKDDDSDDKDDDIDYESFLV